MHEIIETYILTCKLEGFKVEPALLAVHSTPEDEYYSIEIPSNIISYDCIMLFEDKFKIYISVSKLSMLKDIVNNLGLECSVDCHHSKMYSMTINEEDPYKLIEKVSKFEEAIRLES